MESFKKIIRVLFTFVAFQTALVAQESVSWKNLTDVTFTEKYDDELASYIMIPSFGESLVALQGKEIQITGYVIPLDIERNQYVLSANPFASCFFCGNAGPESVMDIHLKEGKKYKTDEYLTFKGTFKLNKDDIYQLNYILDKAEEVVNK